MWLAWLDERFMAENEHRTSECESNQVLWHERSQFWLPSIMVPDALELVSYHHKSRRSQSIAGNNTLSLGRLPGGPG